MAMGAAAGAAGGVASAVSSPVVEVIDEAGDIMEQVVKQIGENARGLFASPGPLPACRCEVSKARTKKGDVRKCPHTAAWERQQDKHRMFASLVVLGTIAGGVFLTKTVLERFLDSIFGLGGLASGIPDTPAEIWATLRPFIAAIPGAGWVVVAMDYIAKTGEAPLRKGYAEREPPPYDPERGRG